jgi:hypothetical protein
MVSSTAGSERSHTDFRRHQCRRDIDVSSIFSAGRRNKRDCNQVGCWTLPGSTRSSAMRLEQHKPMISQAQSMNIKEQHIMQSETLQSSILSPNERLLVAQFWASALSQLRTYPTAQRLTPISPPKWKTVCCCFCTFMGFCFLGE